MPEKQTYEELESQVRVLEKALSESEKRFRMLLRNSSDIQVIIDADGIEQFVSDSVLAITGYSPHELIGKSGFEFVHPDDFGVLRDALERVKNEGIGFVRAEYRHRKKDGTWLNLEAVGTNLLDDPSIKGIVINVRDVTRERRAEKELLESQSWLQSIFSAAPVGLAIVKERTFISVNETYCHILGYSEAELIGRTTRMLYEDEAERIRVGRDLYMNLWDLGLTSTETRHVNKDGKVLNIFLKAAPVNIEDPERGVVVSVEDITERRRVEKALQNSEERYRSIIENIQEGYYEVDIAGNFIFFNEAMSKILEYEKTEMMGMNNRNFSSQEDARKQYAVFNKVYREGVPAKGFHWQIHWKGWR